MKRAFQLLLVTTFIFGILSTSINAQSTIDLEKKWSRIQIDKNNTTPINPDYRYIPGPPVYQKYDIGETDLLVMSNYSGFPETNTT